MLHELADESKNQGLNVNKSKTKVIMENDTSMYVNKTQRTLKTTSTWNSDTASEKTTKTRRFKDESRSGGQHSPNTATSSRVTLEHA